MLEEYFASSDLLSEEEEKEQFDDYYLNVCFIYLNDDDIPEMLLSHGYTPNDAVRDLSDRRIYLYTYKNGKAVQLRSELGETEGFYAQLTPFRYAERKSAVLCEGHYMYGFFFDTPSNDDHDHLSDLITQIDHWNFDTLSCESTAMNIKLEHAVYDEMKNETYEDADVSYDYYLDVKEITRDSDGVMDPLKGKKVDEISYDAANEALWNGESYKTISVSDFDKIYCDYDIPESLAKCYQKQLGNN